MAAFFVSIVVAGSAAGAPGDLLIRTTVVQGSQEIRALGPWRVGGTNPAQATVAAAARVFGPYVCKRQRGLQVAVWSTYGITGRGPEPCATGGWLGSAALSGPRWRTGRGLRTGMTAAELRRRHPHAVRVRGGYCLDRRYTSGPGEQVGGAICAELRNGRLAAFHVGLAYP